MKTLLRRNLGLTTIVGTLLLLLVVLTVLNRDDAYPDRELHPDNPEPTGARAVAQVLRERGVDVSVAHGEGALREHVLDRGTTVMVTSTAYLGDDTAATFFELSRDAGALVVTLPPPGLLRAAVPGVGIDGERGGTEAAACQDPLLVGLTIDVRRSPSYDVPGAVECFGSLVARVRSLYVVGGADLFTNGSIVEADNAAVALRLLGQHDRLVWYVPDPADVGAAGGASVSELLPRWLGPALILVGGALLALLLWRGRRLGPVTVEPLPVVVRNSEAVEARGRLYRRSRDRAHVARTLRSGTRDRLAAHLALPLAVPDAVLHEQVAAATGRTPGDVAALLADGAVVDDAGLVRLAGGLAALEEDFDPDKEETR